jgi:Flp pilus assembly protein CpaB
MSSIAAGVNAERTNRWLLIGAAVLAVLAGVLVFALLANVGDDDEGGGGGSGNAPTGDNTTLVARQDIEAGTTLRADMFDVREYDAETVVSNPVASLEAVEGQVTSTDILKGNQLSSSYLQGGTGAEDLEAQLPFLFDKGLRGIGIATDDVKIVGGHVRPGDYVDVIWQWIEDPTPGSTAGDDIEFQHSEYLFQNIEVLARTSNPVDGVVVLDPETGGPVETTEEEQAIDRRNGDVEPGDDAHVLVLKLTPEETLRLMQSIKLGEITFSLRAYGDEEIRDIPPIIEPVTNQ